jgi:hypothetical protein
VHGRAAILDMRSTANEELRRTVLDVYTPRSGPEWEVFSDANVCMRIEPTRMFTFSLG